MYGHGVIDTISILIMTLSKTEIMVLSAIACFNYQDYKHLTKTFKRLSSSGLITVIYDEQGKVISATIEPKGKTVIASLK